MNCIHCDKEIVYDADHYAATGIWRRPLTHDHCSKQASRESVARSEAVSEGRTNVPNMTPEERDLVLAIRKEQRDAVTD